MIITRADIENMDKLERVELATTLPGAKPICLVGTRSLSGLSNLAPFSSITHLGSNPILIGMVTRPDTVDRHTLKNIIETKCWTLNHVTTDIVGQAHQCSARYPDDVSEFQATGLTELNRPDYPAPFVAESPIRIGLLLKEILDIHTNNTKLIVGEVTRIEIPDAALKGGGQLDISSSLASTALGTYFKVSEYCRLPYAKP